jgi:hypothetical protein
MIDGDLWNAELVGAAIVQAFLTLARMPHAGGPRGPGGNWPKTMIEFSDQVGWAGMDPIEKKMREEAANRGRIQPPNSEEIKRMDTAFDWLKQLRLHDTGMAIVTTLWALRTSQGRSVKWLCREKSWAPRTFFRKREKALSMLAGWLNERAVPVWAECQSDQAVVPRETGDFGEIRQQSGVFHRTIA